MTPCAPHTAAAQAALTSTGMEARGGEAVASLWSSHGSALALAGVDVSAGDFCPLCVIELRTPGAAATWLANACDAERAAGDAERAAQLAETARLRGVSAAAALATVAEAAAAAAIEENAAGVQTSAQDGSA